mmetsp:Transcript_355/g.694  ORF Transcript_355/g.694 Transcript_355/m.694 type:complete len:147 (-) Transcript_355:150-590(-)
METMSNPRNTKSNPTPSAALRMTHGLKTRCINQVSRVKGVRAANAMRTQPHTRVPREREVCRLCEDGVWIRVTIWSEDDVRGAQRIGVLRTVDRAPEQNAAERRTLDSSRVMCSVEPVTVWTMCEYNTSWKNAHNAPSEPPNNSSM